MDDLRETPYGILTPGGLVGIPEPSIKVIAEHVKSDGPSCVEYMRRIGSEMDPWQEYCLEHMLGRRSSGQFSARTYGLVVARQQGKSELAAARIIWGLYVLKEKEILFTAHRRDTALQIFQRVEAIIKSSPMLKKRTRLIRQRNGDESVITNDGCVAKFKVRKKNSGRGLSPTLLLIDEAMECDRQFLGDVMPAISAQKYAQLIAMGSAGNPNSEAFGDLRRRAFGERPGALTWHEWSLEMCDDYCTEGCGHIDPYSVEAFRMTNPAYGIRISHEAIEDELATMAGDLSNFHRERLSVGDWPVDMVDFSVIPREAWDAAEIAPEEVRLDPEATPKQQQFVLAVSMSADRTSTEIMAVSFLGGQHRKVAIQRLTDSNRSGTAWVYDRLIELRQKWRSHGLLGFVIDSRGQASTLIPELQRKGIKIFSPSTLEYAQSCAEFAVGVVGTKPSPHEHEDDCGVCAAHLPYVHHIGDIPLTESVAAATKRRLANLWAWARPTDASSIVALEAATLGVWGLQKSYKDQQMKTFRISGGGSESVD